nr:sugar O-acetyltransferase [Lacrimispora saccharolytica]
MKKKRGCSPTAPLFEEVFMDLREKMKSGKLYSCDDEDLMAEQTGCLEILYDYNQTRPSEGQKRQDILKKLFAEIGKNCYIEPPLHANWGKHVHMGNDVYANFHLTLVDDADIFIGNHVMFGPNVVVDTAAHPIRPDIRKKQIQFNVPVTIEDNVWVGAGSIILPGVRIGENSVIGAGSVVTRDIPANVVAYGSPCRVIRAISERDWRYYFKDWEIDLE